MRFGLLTILLFSFALVQGQSLKVTSTSSNNLGKIGEEIIVPIKIENTSNRPINIVIERLEQTIGTSQVSKFCWGDECFESGITKLPLSKRINPGQKDESFKSILETGLVEGISSVKYKIYDKHNPGDFVIYEVNFEVNNDSERRILFESKDFLLNEIYPNPVSEHAYVNYQVKDEKIKAKIVIHNILGSVMGSY
ncbi:MAG: hypothetical protein AAFX87_30600, partial [Bacteroidota bacterium]